MTGDAEQLREELKQAQLHKELEQARAAEQRAQSTLQSYLDQIDDMGSKITQQEAELIQLRSQLAQAEGGESSADAEVERLRKELAASDMLLKRCANDALKMMSERGLAELQTEQGRALAEALEERNQARKQADALRQDLDRIEQERDELRERAASLENHITVLKENAGGYKATVGHLQERLRSSMDHANELADDLTKAEQQRSEVADLHRSCQEELDVVMQQRNEALGKVHSLEDGNQELLNRLKAVRQELAECHRPMSGEQTFRRDELDLGFQPERRPGFTKGGVRHIGHEDEPNQYGGVRSPWRDEEPRTSFAALHEAAEAEDRAAGPMQKVARQIREMVTSAEEDLQRAMLRDSAHAEMRRVAQQVVDDVLSKTRIAQRIEALEQRDE